MVCAGETGALEAFVSVLSGPPGIRPESIFHDVTGPLLVIWGEKDQVTDLSGPIGRFFKEVANTRPNTEFVVLPGAQRQS